MTQAQDRHETLARVAAMLARRLSDSPRSMSQVSGDAQELCRLSRSLSRIDERNCNEDLTCKRCDGDGFTHDAAEDSLKHHAAVTRKDCAACAGRGRTTGRREARLEAKARAIAAQYGCRVYFQGDPRGAAVYLIPQDAGPQSEDDSHYSQRGVAAY